MGSWSFGPQLQRATEARQGVAWSESLKGGLEGVFNEAVKINPKL